MRQLIQCVDFLWVLIQIIYKFKKYYNIYEIIGNLNSHWIYNGIKKPLLINKSIMGTRFSP